MCKIMLGTPVQNCPEPSGISRAVSPVRLCRNLLFPWRTPDDPDVESRAPQSREHTIQFGLLPRDPLGQFPQWDRQRGQHVHGVVLDP
jgi:hypothetical protein